MSRGVSFSAILGTIETMADARSFWVKTSPPLVRKAYHTMLGEKPIRDFKGRIRFDQHQNSVIKAFC